MSWPAKKCQEREGVDLGDSTNKLACIGQRKPIVYKEGSKKNVNSCSCQNQQAVRSTGDTLEGHLH